MRVLFNLTLSVLLSHAQYVKADDKIVSLTLDQLVSNVLETNPELQFYKSELAAAKAEQGAAGLLQNPELSTEIGRKRASEGGLSAEGTAWSVSVSQTFEFPELREAVLNGALTRLRSKLMTAFVASLGFRAYGYCNRRREQRCRGLWQLW
jgi:outer membrane protein, heavy metal efflux system